MSSIAGIVLCGGQSARMGTPKAWLPFGGEAMLVRVVRTVVEAVGSVVVVAAPGQDLPPLPADVEVVRDDVPGCGPLAGLAAGLAALAGRCDAAYLSSCDVPLLKPAFVHRVMELLGGALAAVARVGGRLHPLAAAYRVEALPQIRAMLDAGHLRITDLFDSIPTRVLTEDELANTDPTFDSLRNVNTPEEYAAALRHHQPKR